MTAKAEVRRRRQEEVTAKANNLWQILTTPQQKAMNLAREKGASC